MSPSAALAPVPPGRALAVRGLTGRQKAAILCMALGPDQSQRLLHDLTREEAELIAGEMQRMGRPDPDAAEAVLGEWVEMTIANDAVSAGGVEYARSVLEKALGPQKAEGILNRVTKQLADTGGIERLQHADPKQVANMFRTEHPQTAALVLAHMSPEHAAGVLRELGPDISAEITYRIARMQKVSPDMLTLIEKTLGSNADFDFQHGVAAAGGPQSVAALLNLLHGPLEKSILDRLAEQDPAISEQIRNLMFVFEDLRSVDDRALQRLLRDVDTKMLAVALKGGSAELRQRIVSQMSQRAAAALTDEIELLGPTRMRDVEAAQAGIIAQARGLEAAGEIVLMGGKDDVVVG